MATTRVFKLSICLAAALLATVALRTLDGMRQQQHLTATSLAWARQIATQLEGLSYTAREKGEKDPLGWAADVLTQGIAPRAVRVARFQSLAETPAESYELDRGAGEFRYDKVLSPENGRAVRITLTIGYSGFLGARSPLGSDATTAACFLLAATLAALALNRKDPGGDFAGLRAAMLDWIARFRALLSEAGRHLAETLAETRKVLDVSRVTNERLESLRAHAQDGLLQMRQAAQDASHADEALARAESLALKLLGDAPALGPQGKPVLEAAGKLHRFLLDARTAREKNADAMARLNDATFALLEEADAACGAYARIHGDARAMNDAMKRTTESMLEQAKSLQKASKKYRAG